MELAEIRQRIKDTPLVKKLPEDMQQRFVIMMLIVAETEEVSREEKIFEQGAKDTDQSCIILEGMIRIITEENDKKTIEAPEILGKCSSLHRKARARPPRSALHTARAYCTKTLSRPTFSSPN